MRAPVVPSNWFVGFCGHRSVGDADAIQSILTRELRKLHERAPSQLVGVSSLAAGSDQLFLRACAAEGVPYEVYLPFPVEEFKKDYDAADWPAAQQLMDAAIVCREGNEKNKRPDGYRICGIEIVDECDVLMVIWNGEAAAGAGGTGKLVSYAQSLQRPLVWIHSETLEVTFENLDEKLFHDKPTEQMRKLLEPAKSEGELPPVEARAAVERLMERADAFATRSAPSVRGFAAALILVNLMIIAFGTVGAIADLFHTDAGKRVEAFFNVLRFLLFIVVFGVAVSNIMKSRQVNWLNARYIAEMCRSILATWDLPVRVQHLLSGGPHELAHIERSVVFLRSLGHKPAAGEWTDVARRYVKERIDGQLRYYRDKSEGLVPRRRLLRFLVAAGMVLSGLLMLGLVVDSLFGRALGHHEMVTGIMSQLLGLTPIIATTALSLIYVYEIQRRLVHNGRLIRVLTHGKAQILSAPTVAALESHVTHCERALLSEVQDWYYYSLYGR